ncbi:MAG: glycoside hydrolase family 43 protein [Polyangia bacterium]
MSRRKVLRSSLRKLLGLVTVAAVLLGGSLRASATTYIFSTFTGDDAVGMKLSIYTSTDSINFTLLSATGFGGNTSYIRDPSIMKYSDGKYYVTYTDPETANCCTPEDHFGIAVSSDLINWTNLTTVSAGVADVSRTWAPEWFVEGDGTIRIIANIDTGNELPNFQQYVFTAQDSTLTSWSGPTELGIATNYIDTFIAKLGTTYHAFLKNDGTRYLEHATAENLTGPWTFVGTGDWAGWGSGLEGPAIVQLDDGQYRMYVDPQQGGVPYQYMTSSDLNTWSAKTSMPGAAGAVVRHGTIIRDTTGFGSNGFLTAAGGSSGTGGSTGAGGSSGTGGSTGAAGSTSAAGSSGVGGSTTRGGATATGGSTAAAGSGAGGSKATTGSSGTGGSIGNGGSKTTAGSTSTTGTTGGTTGGAGGSTAGADGGGGSAAGGASAETVDAGVAAAGSTDTGSIAAGGGSVAAPDAAISTGGAAGTTDIGMAGTWASGEAGNGRSTSAAGGTTATGGTPDAEAGARAAATASGCGCALNRGSSSTRRSEWLLFALVALVVHFRRRHR